jgi:epoxide hydrolase-like predicted phosphatase
MKYLFSLFLLGIFMTSCSSEPCTPTQKVLVFDFGGVVGGTDRRLVAKKIAPLLGLSLEEAIDLEAQSHAEKKSGTPLKTFWEQYEKQANKPLPPNWATLFEDIKLSAIRANSKMLLFIDQLRSEGYRVALLSNVTAARAAFIRSKGIYTHFDPAVLSCETGARKPHPEAYQALLTLLNVKGEECLYIDNNPANLEAAKTLGMDCILFKSRDGLCTELARRGIAVKIKSV